MAALEPLGASRSQATALYSVHTPGSWRLRDGTDIVIRPIGRHDDAIELAFIRGLSRQTGYNRLLGARKLSAWEIRRLTRIDYDREMALIAITGSGPQTRLLGDARYVRDAAAGGGAEFAIVVADAWQRKGVGTLLLQALLRHAHSAGIGNLHGITLATNYAMQNLGRKLGFAQSPDPLDATVRHLAANASLGILAGAVSAHAGSSAAAAANDACIAPRATPQAAE